LQTRITRLLCFFIGDKPLGRRAGKAGFPAGMSSQAYLAGQSKDARLLLGKQGGILKIGMCLKIYNSLFIKRLYIFFYSIFSGRKKYKNDYFFVSIIEKSKIDAAQSSPL